MVWKRSKESDVSKDTKIIPRCKKSYSRDTALWQSWNNPWLLTQLRTQLMRGLLSPHSTAGSSAPSGTKHRLQGSKGWSQPFFCTLNLCQSFLPRNASSHSLAGTARLPQRKGSGRIFVVPLSGAEQALAPKVLWKTAGWAGAFFPEELVYSNPLAHN